MPDVLYLAGVHPTSPGLLGVDLAVSFHTFLVPLRCEEALLGLSALNPHRKGSKASECSPEPWLWTRLWIEELGVLQDYGGLRREIQGIVDTHPCSHQLIPVRVFRANVILDETGEHVW